MSGEANGDDQPATYEQLQAGYEQMRDECRKALDGWTSERRLLWTAQDALRGLIALVANTGLHNSIEAAAARKVLRSPGWTEKGHAWLDAFAPLRPREPSLGEVRKVAEAIDACGNDSRVGWEWWENEARAAWAAVSEALRPLPPTPATPDRADLGKGR